MGFANCTGSKTEESLILLVSWSEMSMPLSRVAGRSFLPTNAMNLELNNTKVSKSDDLNTCNVVRLVSDPIYDKTIERSQVMIR